MSKKPALSSRPLKGFSALPSFSILPAQTFQLIGLNGSAPTTSPKHMRNTDKMVSILMSRGTEEVEKLLVDWMRL